MDTNILPARKEPVKRKIFLWKRADKCSMSDDLKKFTEEFVHTNTTQTEVNTFWTTFKQTCIENVNKYYLPSTRQPALNSPGATGMFVAKHGRKQEHTRKRVSPNILLTGRDIRRYRKMPRTYAEMLTMTTSETWLANLALRTRGSTPTSRV